MYIYSSKIYNTAECFDIVVSVDLLFELGS